MDRHQEAMRAIGADAEFVMSASADRLRSADAIIAVLQHAVSGPDVDVLRRFHSAGGEGFSPTAVTSMAVLTKVEEYWPESDDPLREGQKNATRVWAAPATRRMFHRVLPVCSKVAEAAAVFTEDDFGALKELTTARAATLDRRLRNVAGFIRDDTLPLSADDRKRLIGVFHRYGIWLACQMIRNGVDNPAELQRAGGTQRHARTAQGTDRALRRPHRADQDRPRGPGGGWYPRLPAAGCLGPGPRRDRARHRGDHRPGEHRARIRGV